MTMTEINDRTGFANGTKFIDADDVRAYFRREVMEGCFGGTDYSDLPTQDELDDMAEVVIENHWHME